MPPVDAVLRLAVVVVVLRCLTVEPPTPLPPRGAAERAGDRAPDPTLVTLGDAGWRQDNFVITFTFLAIKQISCHIFTG